MTLDEFKNYLRSKDIIRPIRWSEFHHHFEMKLRGKANLPLPFILNAAHSTNDYQKRERFEEQITIISENLGLDSVRDYLEKFYKDSDYHKSEHVDPKEKTAMEITAEVEELREKHIDTISAIISEGELYFKKLVELKPELIENDKLLELLTNYEEGNFDLNEYDDEIRERLLDYEYGVSDEREMDEIMKLIDDKSKFETVIKEIYENFISQRHLPEGHEIGAYCNYLLEIY